MKSATLDLEAQRFVDELSRTFRQNRAQFSAQRLVALTRLAVQKAFPESSRENKVATAMLRGISVREKMASEEGGSMSAEETARLLGITKQSVLNLYHGGKLLGWKTEKQGAIRFPVWQFEDRDLLPGMREALSHLNAPGTLDDWARVGFFLQSHGQLKGKRPLDLLRGRQVEPVLKAADAFRSGNSSFVGTGNPKASGGLSGTQIQKSLQRQALPRALRPGYSFEAVARRRARAAPGE